MARIQKQVAIALPSEVRERLEKAAEAAGLSFSEEIRRRLIASFAGPEEDSDVRRLQGDVARFAEAVEHETGQDWTSHGGAARALQAAISARLGRRYGANEPAKFGRGISTTDYVDYADVGRSVEETDDALSRQLLATEQSLAEEIARIRDMLGKTKAPQRLQEALAALEQQMETLRRLRGK
jgi:hypothetical protein